MSGAPLESDYKPPAIDDLDLFSQKPVAPVPEIEIESPDKNQTISDIDQDNIDQLTQIIYEIQRQGLLDIEEKQLQIKTLEQLLHASQEREIELETQLLI